MDWLMGSRGLKLIEMTMLDQILQMLSPQKDLEKAKKTSSSSSDYTSGKLKKKGKKTDKKTVVEEKKPYLDPDLCQHRAAGLNLAKITKKPAYIESKEWVATHTISLFNNVNHLYGSVSEFCTAESCPLMQGPCQTHYTWVEERGKKLKCTAPQYIDYVMTFCQKCVSNQELFPTKYAQNFSENFTNDIKKMLRFLFHVISHMYYAHFVRLKELDLHVYLNIVFKHFTYLVREFKLLERRDTASLDDLVDMMGMYAPGTSTEALVLREEVPSISESNSRKSSNPSTRNFQQAPSTKGNGSTTPSFPSFTKWPTST